MIQYRRGKDNRNIVPQNLGAKLLAPVWNKGEERRQEGEEVVWTEQEPYRVDRALCVARLAVVAD